MKPYSLKKNGQEIINLARVCKLTSTTAFDIMLLKWQKGPHLHRTLKLFLGTPKCFTLASYSPTYIHIRIRKGCWHAKWCQPYCNKLGFSVSFNLKLNRQHFNYQFAARYTNRATAASFELYVWWENFLIGRPQKLVVKTDRVVGKGADK